MITPSEAIEIAVKAIEGKVEPQFDSPIHVELKKARYIVTFEHRLAAGIRGPDYDAKVEIDATSGEVAQILGGS